MWSKQPRGKDAFLTQVTLLWGSANILVKISHSLLSSTRLKHTQILLKACSLTRIRQKKLKEQLQANWELCICIILEQPNKKYTKWATKENLPGYWLTTFYLLTWRKIKWHKTTKRPFVSLWRPPPENALALQQVLQTQQALLPLWPVGTGAVV